MVLVVPSLPCIGESMRLGYDAPMPNPTQEKIVAAVKRGVPEGGRVLELSCGEGHVLRTLCDAGYDVRGTNYSDHGTPPQGIDVDQGVDLLDSLPYDDMTHSNWPRNLRFWVLSTTLIARFGLQGAQW